MQRIRIQAFLAILLCLLLFSCGGKAPASPEPSVNFPVSSAEGQGTTEGIESIETTTAATTTFALTGPQTTLPPLSDGLAGIALPTPRFCGVAMYGELVYAELYQPYPDGSGSLLVREGAFASVPTEHCLPEIAEKIPKAPWSRDPMWTIDTVEGVSFYGGTRFSVYGEDFAPLAENISLAELVTQSHTAWIDRTVYLATDFTFFRLRQAEVTERICRRYFVKVSFAP